MRFEEIGVKDESGLEQDEFSLKRPTFGKDNQLTVIGWKGKTKQGNKLYVVKCSKCAKDLLLHGDGIFKSLKSSLIHNSAHCGCSFNPKWTEDQFKILVERKCKEKDYIFHGFADSFKGHKTKLSLECQKHGVWNTTIINNFIHKDNRCPTCKSILLSESRVLEDSFHINNFIATGKFKEGIKFWKSDRLDTRETKAFWNFTCPICSNDEYVKAGLCSGVFECHSSNLLKGFLSCRCSKNYRWTKEQYEYRIKKKMLESGTTDEFVGFINGFKNQQSMFTRECNLHGNYDTKINSYLVMNVGCTECTNQSQQECYINFIKDNGNFIALKFGIAKDSKQRIKAQNSHSIFSVEQYGVWTFPDVKSCKAAERHIKKHLPCRLLTKEEMPDGYTETTSVENLKEIIKIYEDFGGVRKIIESENLLEDKSL